jgi:nitrogen fixation/metabolism regulation signal transduction histidine kinase
MQPATKFRRRRYFIADSSQPRLLVGIQLIFLILILLAGAVVYVVFNRDLAVTYAQAHIQIKNVQEILLPVLVLANLAGLMLGAILTLFYTHRIAGPVYRLCRILRQVGEGNLNQVVRFRQGDELTELDHATTEMLAALDQRMRTLQQLAKEVTTAVDAAGEAGPPSQARLDHLRDAASAVERGLGEFRLRP